MVCLYDAIERTVNRNHGNQVVVRGEPHSYPRNEYLHLEMVKQRLHQRGRAPQPSLHIGIAGFANFDIAAITHPSAILLLDNNLAQHDFWRIVIQSLCDAKTPEAFRESLEQAIASHPDDDIRSIQTKELQDYLQHADWLCMPGAYGYIRGLAQSGSIASGTLDLFTDSDAPVKLGNMLRRSGLPVDTAYWSNLWYFSRPEDAHGVGHSISEPVYPQGGLHYANKYFGEDGVRVQVHGHLPIEKEPEAFHPLFERFMQNISDIGAGATLHMLTSHLPDMDHALPSGEKAKYPELSDYARHAPLHDKPIYIEGPPRRPQQQWAMREDARMRAMRKRESAL